MPWARLDDTFWRHEKTNAAGPLGVALFAVSLSYCNDRLTDGFIPDTCLWQLLRCQGLSDEQGPVAIERVADQLVAAGLWERVEGGYRVHDYLKYNKTKEQILAERDEARERMQAHRSSAEVRANIGRSSTTPVPGTRNPVPGTRNPERKTKTAAAAAAGADAPTEEPLRARFSALARGCGHDAQHLGLRERTAIGTAAASLREFTPEQIATMCRNFPTHFRGAITPAFVAQNASKLLTIGPYALSPPHPNGRSNNKRGGEDAKPSGSPSRGEFAYDGLVVDVDAPT